MTIAEPESFAGTARIHEEDIVIPTYAAGEPDPNPMFLEKRVYQGSSGRVYPYPFIESVRDEKKDRTWRAVFLENEYIRVMVLPQLGGRIQMALDKTNDYHFVYYNRVIKPALVGLAGPWVSGGIEFNWPQHHRPSTYQELDHRLSENADGSVTLWTSEIEQMSRLRGLTGITLRPGVARIEIAGVSANRTDLPQTMLWWANPAVAVNDDYQSVFPPDVKAVMDHGKRDVSRFPIAVGTYYNQDYSAGVDISWYKNIPVPSSYMVASSRYDFCGGYDHGRRAGLLHVADHHTAPGKKQWTWGNGPFGQVWSEHLTDEDGPYIELMTGVFTDNQPDFAWLHPGEAKTFTQYFFPVREIGYTRNANSEVALNLEFSDSRARIGVYVTRRREKCSVELRASDSVVFRQTADLAPDHPFVAETAVRDSLRPQDYALSVLDSGGRLLLSWTPEPDGEGDIPEAATAAKPPEEIQSAEELVLTGQHLEQYRHATRRPLPYYEEALRRDPGNALAHTALARLMLRRGRSRKAEEHARAAVRRLTLRNGNPYDGEALYLLGLALEAQDKPEDAIAAFARASWNEAWKQAAWYCQARLECRRGRYERALELVKKALGCGGQHLKAAHLNLILLRLTERLADAHRLVEQRLADDPLDYGALAEAAITHGTTGLDEFHRAIRGNAQTAIEVAFDYRSAGRWQEAARLLEPLTENGNANPMACWICRDSEARAGNEVDAVRYACRAEESSVALCFPHRPEEADVLESALAEDPGRWSAAYLLGNILYNCDRHEEAIARWEQSRNSNPGFPTVRRNLALAYFNKRGEAKAARRELEEAFSLNPQDARVFFELDQLARRMADDPAERLARLEEHDDLVARRDDLSLERCSILNQLGRHRESLDLLLKRQFHPWEGGEGKVPAQYVAACTGLARECIRNGEGEDALDWLERARDWPRSLGEGRLTGIRDNNIDYYRGLALRAAGREEEAAAAFGDAAAGPENMAMSMFYYDQPPDILFYQGLALRALGSESAARSRFNRLKDHGLRHMNDECEIDYFAISLPDFLVFEDDLNFRNRVHCCYLIALGTAGLMETEKARKLVAEILDMNPMHTGATILLDETKGNFLG